MKLFDVILKLIKQLTLVESDEYGVLKTDVDAWTDGCNSAQKEDKVKILYYKIHKGVLLRLLMPFLYFALLKWVKDLSADSNDNDLY